MATSRYSVAHQAVLRLLANESLDRRTEILKTLADHPRPLWRNVLYDYVQSQISAMTTNEVSQSALRALSVLEHPRFEELCRAILQFPQSALQPLAFELMVSRNELQHPQVVLQHAMHLLESHGPSSTLEKVIRRWKPREAVPLLLKTLEVTQSRRQAITLLGVVGDLATAEELARRFPNWPVDCQTETLKVLYDMRWPGYVGLASDALKSGDPQVVAKAAEGLSFIQTPAALNGLLAALADQKNDLAFAHICNALTYFSDPPVRVALQELKTKSTESRRNLIVAALKQRKLRSTGIPFLRQGHSASESRLWKEAQQLFDIAIEADPELADAYAARAHVNLQLENVSAAHADFEKAAQLDDDLSLGATGLALCLIMQGDVEAGLRQLESSRARFEKENMFLYNAACVYGRAVLHYEQNAKSPNAEALCQKYRRQSLVDLKRSLDAGFEDIAWAKIDPDLKSIQSSEEFRQIIKLAEEKLPAAN